MIRSSLLAFLIAIAAALPALAQESGGVRLAPGLNGGPVGLARPMQYVRPPLLTARDLQANIGPADRQAQNQAMITRLRGDGGYLAGVGFGAPAAASRQPAQAWNENTNARGGHRSRPIIINNNGPLAVTVGNDNLVQQQAATGPGPIAQQQVASVGGHGAGGGALNLVSGSGNITQRAPN